MCLYPKLIFNKKYTANNKNGGNVPKVKDQRTLWVPVGCGKCMECKGQKARAWSVRLQEELRTEKNGKMITLTFSNEAITHLVNYIDRHENLDGYNLDNKIAKVAVRLFLERWRKRFKKSLRHWLVTELGHNGTENIHLHGIIWTNESRDTVAEIWKYGWIYPRPEMGWTQNYVNERTVNYCVKYVTKMDADHKYYNSIILTSPGIGKNYLKREDAKTNKFNNDRTDETYKTRQGLKINLPVYYRNAIYSEDEREKLWLNKLNKKVRWVNGIKIDVSTEQGLRRYYKVLKEAQEKNARLGYGNTEEDWSAKQYEIQRRNANLKKRMDNSWKYQYLL